MDTFRAGGKGGQNQNKRDTGVRFTHIPSGAVGIARDTRSQLDNKRAAWLRMAKSVKFKLWINKSFQQEGFVPESDRVYTYKLTNGEVPSIDNRKERDA
jgi:protein subunit release factor A